MSNGANGTVVLVGLTATGETVPLQVTADGVLLVASE